ncbi:MAG: hypothetical protein LBR44_05770 [Clostridiales Family XIII bacterium]|jgi:hypothetical protein|nr:hypothetical protein [Clostridiales Family XIII bacterium]
MTGRVFRPRRTAGAVRTVVYILVLIACVAIVYFGLQSLGRTQSGEQAKVAEDAIIRAAVQCYALESRYPPSLEYLEENYGLMLDHDKFVYHYRANGTNLRPEIEVFAYE